MILLIIYLESLPYETIILRYQCTTKSYYQIIKKIKIKNLLQYVVR